MSRAQKYLNEAERFKEKGFYKDAIESYQRAIETDPFLIAAYYNQALLYHKIQQFDNAIEGLKKVIALDPQDASAYNNLGVLFCANNRLVEARIHFEKALSLIENYQEARDNLEKVLEKLRKDSPCTSSQQPIKFHCHKIGFVTLWYERGQAYVTRDIRDALGNNYQTFIFARAGGTTDNPILQTTGEWDTPNLTTHPTYQIPHSALKNWIVNNHLDVVFFNEEYDLGLVETARKCGVKTVGYYVWELFDPQNVTRCKSLYDKIICPTKACYEKFKGLGMNNVEYIQWGVKLNLFKPFELPVNKRIRFFHPAGWGGLYERRGTQFVIDAFQKLNDPKAELLIHTQIGSGIQEHNNIKIIYGTVPREEIIQMYQNADVAVLPSKWEGLGLTFLEAIGCGLPIITTDAPPMNEFVRNGETGLFCRIKERISYKGVFVEGIHADLDHLASQMQRLIDPAIRNHMRKQTIAWRNEQWDWSNTSQKLHNLTRDLIGKTELKNTETAHIHNSGQSDNQPLRLVSKNYAGCELFKKDHRLYIRKDGIEEPLIIHLVGARWSNFPWGMENEIYRALEKMGCQIIDSDFRRDFAQLPTLLKQKAHLLFVVKGNGIPPELIERQPCLTILWYQDDIFAAQHAPGQIAYNARAFDIVYSFDKNALDEYRKYAVKDPRWLPLAMSPSVHRKMYLPKTYDVSFVGNVYPNRKSLFERLQKRFNVFVTRAFMDEMVKIFNQSKIVLNLGIGSTGIQNRVFEALGCGSLLITNEIPSDSRLFTDRKHLVYFNENNIEGLIEYYLSHKEEREDIERAGYLEVYNKHTYEHRMQKILSDVFQQNESNGQTVIENTLADSSCNVSTVSTPTLSVVIATYNRKPNLQRCIESLLQNSEHDIEIVVVDDLCPDGTREWLDEIRTKHKNIVPIHNQTHKGQHRSVNIGCRASRGKYIGLMNDDLEFTKGWDTALTSILESDRSYGAAVPLVLDTNGLISSMGLIEGIVSRKHPQLERIPALRERIVRGKKPEQVTESKQSREVEYGCYVIMKREVWKKTGGVAEDMGRYCVDADLGLKIRIAGYKNMYCPKSVIIDTGLNFGIPESNNNTLKRSQSLFIEKWDAYFGSFSHSAQCRNKYKIFVAAAFNNRNLIPSLQKALDRLSHQEQIIQYVNCEELTERMDTDVMNNLFLEAVSATRPDILLILGGKDINPVTLRILKRKFNLPIVSWWHSELGVNVNEMPGWAIALNKETDVCLISDTTQDYVRHAETQGIKRGFLLDSVAHIADTLPSIINGTIEDRKVLYQDKINQLEGCTSEQTLLDISKFLIEKGMGIIVVPYLERIIHMNPKCLDAYLLLSDQFALQGAFKKAGETLHNALRVPLQSASLDYRLGNVYHKLGNLDEAEKWLKSAQKQNRDDSSVNSVLAQIYTQKGNSAEAEFCIMTSLNKCPNNVNGLIHLGELYKKQNKTDEAISCFQQCLSIDYHHEYNEEIRKNLEELYSIKEVHYDTTKIQLSVILLSFNRAKYMERSLYLLSKQSFPQNAFEIIVIDSSNDNTKAVVRDAIERYGLNIRFFYVPPEGPGPNTRWFNKAVKEARGNIIVWTQPEVLFSERMLDKFFKPHVFEDKLWVSGRMGVVLTRDEQEEIDQVWDKGIEYLLTNFNIRKESYRLGYKFWLPLLVSFKRHDFLTIGGFIEGLPVPRHDDLDLFFRLLAIGFSIHNPPGFQGIHQWHAPMEERGKDLLPLMEKTRQVVYEWRKAFLKGNISAEKYALRNEAKEIGIVSEMKEENIFEPVIAG